MTPAVSNMFSEHDLLTIRSAVEAAEKRTRGEIVPMVVPASGLYRDASHLAGLILALSVLALLFTFDRAEGSWQWSDHHPGWSLLVVLGAYVAGSVLGRLPAIIRLLTPQERMRQKVALRAERAFYEEGLHKTREGTGILIVLSLLERRAQILADRAIDERVPAGTWDALIQSLVQGIRTGRETDALCKAITRCGDLLAEHFPAREGDNPNELSDHLVRGT